MAKQAKTTGPGPWTTFTESPPAVKAVLAGVVINRLGAFLSIFLVLYLTARGYSAAHQQQQDHDEYPSSGGFLLCCQQCSLRHKYLGTPCPAISAERCV